MRTPNHLLMIVSGMVFVAALCVPDRESCQSRIPAPGYTYARDSFWFHRMTDEQVADFRTSMGDQWFRNSIEGQIDVLEKYGTNSDLEKTLRIKRDFDAWSLQVAAKSEM